MQEIKLKKQEGATHPALVRSAAGSWSCLLPVLIAALVLSTMLAAGCTRLLDSYFAGTAQKMEGTITIQGLREQVTVRRDNLGIPFIEAANLEDLAFAMGFVNASDRLGQMISLKLVSQGRVSEMAGRAGLDIDVFMRTINLKKAARLLYEGMSPERKSLLESYARGVNAYIELHRHNLPPELALAGHDPGQWEPIDSISIFTLVNFALAFNMHEEAAALALARTVGPEKTAWLLPVYPDEPIALDEAAKLSGIDLSGTLPALNRLTAAADLKAGWGLMPVAASNNWVIAPEKTLNKASILANDTHLLLSLPSLWNLVHVRCKGTIDAAGVNIAGVPAIVAGYNGRIAWGMTMVMADNQDIFLEQLRMIGTTLHYRCQDDWLPVVERIETICVRGQDPESVTVFETRHGPLLNDVLKNPPRSPFMPDSVQLPLGAAFSWAAFEPGDESVDAFFSLGTACSVEEALPLLRRIQAIPLNMVVADRENIAWQVTGRYPLRKNGRGLMPSPGWTGEYDWVGYLDPDELPRALNPAEGFIGTANHRTVPPGYPHVLSSSWYWPSRAERITEMIASSEEHTLESSMGMQLDVSSTFAPKVRRLFLEGPLSCDISREIDSWEDQGQKDRAQEALGMLRDCDGIMTCDSRGGLIIGALMHTLTANAFLDELGPEGSPAWKAFITSNNASYCATTDHLLVRGDESPFWDDISTPGLETKARILARSLADAIALAENRLGPDRSRWTWGALHTYRFRTESSKMAPHLGFIQRKGMQALASYFNRGPFPAPGDHSTLNVSAYTIGQDFDTWLIPAMRMVVDFSREEPLSIINSTGQSNNPVSPHYDDGIHAWLQGSYQPMPFGRDAIERQYDRVLTLAPAAGQDTPQGP
ncbi:MAG: penicillin acylase family protein [Deltaproteobacteria bacterium]|nr:penicillin acylase family protein [Deltaproteobacteria bacterium]